ncbi:hypothetical protein CHS0354_022468 [Potamilus streckersoni]|uniref:XK-related protein n=1 Tax=Potamilus streckersoni TaxID=2493646 RepID=A0AAE0SYA8_9BIVA|nr:hypothetical protein CHS0354_022468 [Potamilus streckersoni]
MGTLYMLIGSILFVVETALQISSIAQHRDLSEVLFILLLTIVVTPLIIVNFISATLVTITQDFTDKTCGRAICIVFHSFQLGLVWRSLKLVILFEERDLVEYLNLKLIHTGFQSLPFAIVLSYSLLIHESDSALLIITIIITMLSSAISLGTYFYGSSLYESEDFEKTSIRLKRTSGVLLLMTSTLLVLISRCSSIVLFTLAEPYWLALPLGIHYITYFLCTTLHLKCKGKLTCIKLLQRIYVSVINIFDLIDQGFRGVQCKYVLFYTAVLLQNIVMCAIWVLNSDTGYVFKLGTITLVLMSFIVGMIIKLASCGCIHDDHTENLIEDPDADVRIPIDGTNALSQANELPHSMPDHSSPSLDPCERLDIEIHRKDRLRSARRSNSSERSSVTSSNRDRRVNVSQIMVNVHHDNQGYVEDIPPEPINSSSSSTSRKDSTITDSNLNFKDLEKRKQKFYSRSKNVLKTTDSLGDIASSNSRNTNTITMSVKSYYNNSFEDPYRERFRLRQSGDRNHYKTSRLHDRSVARRPMSKIVYVNGSATQLHGSQLYPFQENVRQSSQLSEQQIETARTSRWLNPWRGSISTTDYGSHSGYTTDISNSDYLSINDGTMEDSSDWSESSETSGALTWPPSNAFNAGSIYSLPSDQLSTTDNIIHWLSTLDKPDQKHEQNSAHEMSAQNGIDPLQKFRVDTKRRGRLKRLFPKPNGMFLKFCSLNYKHRQKTTNKNEPTEFPMARQPSHVQSDVTSGDSIKRWNNHGDLSVSNDMGGGGGSTDAHTDFVQESVV